MNVTRILTLSTPMGILRVEDDAHLWAAWVDALPAQSYIVDATRDGEVGWDYLVLGVGLSPAQCHPTAVQRDPYLPADAGAGADGTSSHAHHPRNQQRQSSGFGCWRRWLCAQIL